MATEKVTNKLHNTSLHACLSAELIPEMKAVKTNTFPTESIANVNLGLLYILTLQTFDPINGCPIFPKQRAISLLNLAHHKSDKQDDCTVIG